MLTRRFKALSKKHSVQQQLIKHFQNPLVITKKKKNPLIFFFSSFFDTDSVYGCNVNHNILHPDGKKKMLF